MWVCPQCRERLEESFDLCWKCGTDRGSGPNPGPSSLAAGGAAASGEGRPLPAVGGTPGGDMGAVEGVPSSSAEVPEGHNPEEFVLALYSLADGFLEEGVPVAQVEQSLLAKGLDREAARLVLRNLLEVRARAARRNRLQGALWCLGGLAVSVGSWILAAGEGSFVVASGAIAYGGYLYVHGKVQAMGIPENW